MKYGFTTNELAAAVGVKPETIRHAVSRNLFSHAHSGALYRLEAGEARSYAEWKQAIESADDDPDIFVELARGIEADPFLGETARSKLKKEVGRVGTIVEVMRDAESFAIFVALNMSRR